jgi:hypothetical protein
MKENLIQIASNIKTGEETFSREHFTSVVARVHGEFDGNVKTYWFVMRQLKQSMYGRDALSNLGIYIPRNSSIATRILNEELGVPIEYTTLNNIKRQVKHRIIAENKSDLANRSIELVDDSQKYFYSDLYSFISALQNKQREIEENERKQEEQRRQIEELKKQEETAHQRSVLTKGLKKLEEEKRILTLQQEEMNNLTRFIRQQGKLRFNPILDPVQNRIKTQNLFNDVTIVIDGGPGTGKTTTMIQRLKYLTDWDAIEEDFIEGTNRYGLSAAQRDALKTAIDQDRDWVFFSPSELLKEYLKEAMDKEGLTKIGAKVWSWDEYRKRIIRELYQLVGSSTDNTPFVMARTNEQLIYNHSNVIISFNDYLISQWKSIHERLPKLPEDVQKYRWLNIARIIQERLSNTDDYSLQQFIQLFYRLEQTYSIDCRELLAENRNRVKNISEELFAYLLDDEERYRQMTDLVEKSISQEQTDDDDEDDIDNEQVEVAEEETSIKISRLLRQWFKRYCYAQMNSEIKLTARQEKVSLIVLPLLKEVHNSQVTRVGELALFEQFAKYTRGIRSNVFGGFAAKYKRFRRQVLVNQSGGWNLTLLKEMLQRREGKELHAQEQALLIGTINNIVKEVLRIVRTPINHVFVDAYNEVNRPIIGIDEVTDFCECDIYAMESLLHNDYNSLTLSGDLMQRLTTSGITSWDDVKPLVRNIKVVEMKTSYRQSTKLLKVAKDLYLDTIGDEPNYVAYMKSTKVPKPIAYISTDERDKIEWIEKRISEVYKAYGKQLPSIAIFLNNKEDISRFARELEDTDFAVDNGIGVVDGSAGNVLGTKNQIRVYPIDVVKGMEFDVVFFHNIDKNSNASDMIKRYIYVGVSRAAFFLGITLEEESPDITKYFAAGETWEKLV